MNIEQEKMIDEALQSLYPLQEFEEKAIHKVIDTLPSVQPEITLESAIAYLHEIGWMQNHDKQMYEMGLKEQLADDSGSYDALLPSAQSTSSKMEQVPTRCNLIDRQAAINKILGQPPEPHYPSWYAEQIKELPPAQPEIIYCKDCRKHNKKVGFDENFHTIWKEDACPLVSWRGKAKGHEFDYQFCAYAERREETE